MRKEDKIQQVEILVKQLTDNSMFYLADISGLDAEQTSILRRTCFKQGVKLSVVKNTLLKIAMEKVEKDFDELYDVLKGNTALMFTETGNVPAKLIIDYTKKHKTDKPALKAAFIEEMSYVGADNLDFLASIKSKDELIGDIIGLLQSPAKNVISALESGGNTIAGIVKTLSERPE
ncbi:MAG: 50S ribosomal protein L10 [Chlamydiia bacterium]|nr:50S ribosomal protein L10 [Chlamydiia bacterium]